MRSIFLSILHFKIVDLSRQKYILCLYLKPFLSFIQKYRFTLDMKSFEETTSLWIFCNSSKFCCILLTSLTILSPHTEIQGNRSVWKKLQIPNVMGPGVQMVSIPYRRIALIAYILLCLQKSVNSLSSIDCMYLINLLVVSKNKQGICLER